jgi:hypothetical protein
VMAGIGGNNTAAVVELAKRSHEAGATSLLAVAPYYNKPSQEGLYQHFRAAADATPLPLFCTTSPGARSPVSIPRPPRVLPGTPGPSSGSKRRPRTCGRSVKPSEPHPTPSMSTAAMTARRFRCSRSAGRVSFP